VKRTVYIFGEPQDEHLRAEVTEDLVVLVSRERAFSRVASFWRERNLAALPREAWLAVARTIEEGEG
jgi:hypothetical protein